MLAKTSLDAYKSVDGKMLAEHYQRILAALDFLEIAIYEQIADGAGFPDKNQVSRRLKELENMELVYKTGTKAPTKSGRQAYQYRLRTPETVLPPMEKFNPVETTAADYACAIINKHEKLKQQTLFGE